MYIAVCPQCRKKVGVPRPGAIDPKEEKAVQCPHCEATVDINKGYDVTEPEPRKKPFDLLKVEGW